MSPSFQATAEVLLDFLVLGGIMTWVNGKVRVFKQPVAIPLYIDILTHGYMRNTWVGRDVREVRAPVRHTGLQTLVLIPTHPDLLQSGILMDQTVLSPESYCNIGLSGIDPITLR